MSDSRPTTSSVSQASGWHRRQKGTTAREQRFLEYQRTREEIERFNKATTEKQLEKGHLLFRIQLDDMAHREADSTANEPDMERLADEDPFLRALLSKKRQQRAGGAPVVADASTAVVQISAGADETGRPPTAAAPKCPSSGAADGPQRVAAQRKPHEGSPGLTQADKLTALQAQVRLYTAQLEGLRCEHRKQLQLREDQQRKSQNANLLNQRIFTLQSKLKHQQAENGRLQQQLDSKTSEVRNLRDQLQLQSHNLKQGGQLQNQLLQQKYQQIMTKMQDDLDLMVAKNAHLTAQLSEQENTARHQASQLLQLQRENESLTASNQLQQSKILALESGGDPAQHSATSAGGPKHSENQQLTSLQEQNAKLEAELRDIVTELQTRLRVQTYQTVFVFITFIVFVATALVLKIRK